MLNHGLKWGGATLWAEELKSLHRFHIVWTEGVATLRTEELKNRINVSESPLGASYTRQFWSEQYLISLKTIRQHYIGKIIITRMSRILQTHTVHININHQLTRFPMMIKNGYFLIHSHKRYTHHTNWCRNQFLPNQTHPETLSFIYLTQLSSSMANRADWSHCCVGYFGLTSVNRRTEDVGERSTSPKTRIRPNIKKARLPWSRGKP
jgi:hypothetical protein